jgi:hypothetical protein
MRIRVPYILAAPTLLAWVAVVENHALRAQDAAGAQEAANLLATARQAMGGQAAFTALKSLELFGTVQQTAPGDRTITLDGQVVTVIFGGRVNMDLDIKVALPDRYVRFTRSSGEGFRYVDEYRGFNGSDLIRDTSAPGGGVTDSKFMPSPKLPATRLQYLIDAKHSFVSLLLPFLVNAYDGYSLRFSAAATGRLPSGPATFVNVESGDGLKWRLYLDDATHLPVLMTGRMKPMVSQLLFEFCMPEEDWQMTISDYRVSNGFKWPRKLSAQFGTDVIENVEFTRFSINPKFGDHTFAPNDGR